MCCLQNLTAVYRHSTSKKRRQAKRRQDTDKGKQERKVLQLNPI